MKIITISRHIRAFVKKREIQLRLIAGSIACMHCYAVYIKLRNYKKANLEMRAQLFSDQVADVLTWAIPMTEIVLILLLLHTVTRLKALWASFGMLMIFTVYIGLAMSGIFGREPCSCGGILGNVNYGWQILFNLPFLFLSLWGISLEKNWNKRNLRNSLMNMRFYLKKTEDTHMEKTE